MEPVKSLTKALIAVQSKLKPVEKTKVNPYYKSSYADLQTIWDSCQKVLADNGFAVSQITCMENGIFGLRTILLHESGERLDGFYILNPAKPNDPQALGSALTYSRRYALSAMLGIIADSDDDGNAASHTAPAEAPKDAPRASSGDSGASGAATGNDIFIPESVSIKSGTTNGKAWTQYSIKSPEGSYYSTFDEKIAEMATQCKDESASLSVTYVMKGKYRNITEAVPDVLF